MFSEGARPIHLLQLFRRQNILETPATVNSAQSDTYVGPLILGVKDPSTLRRNIFPFRE